MLEAVLRSSLPFRVLDVSAIGLSGLCLVHCLVLPVAAALLPALGVWSEVEWVHWAFVALAAPISLLALRPSPCLRPSRLFLSLAAAGLTLLMVGAAGRPSHDWTRGLTVAGGLLLAAAHIGNWRRHATCEAHPNP